MAEVGALTRGELGRHVGPPERQDDVGRHKALEERDIRERVDDVEA